MALVRNITKRIDIPGEDGQFAILRKLSWKQLELASNARAEAALAKMRTMGGEVYRAINDVATQAVSAAAASSTLKPRADLKNSYDVETVLRAGVVNLSYSETFTADDVMDLDEPTKNVLFDAIMTLSDVGQTEAQQETERKNG